MKNMQQQQQLLHEQEHQRRDLEDGFVKNESNPSYNNDDQTMNSCWEEDGSVGEDLLNDALMSYEDFPSLPDFPCISSSSSSSSSSSHPQKQQQQNQHAGVACTTPSSSSSTTTSSASSSASWAMIKTGHHEHASVSMEIQHQNSQDEAEMINRMNSGECMDVLEGLGDMDLLDTDDMWDPSSLFPYEDVQDQHQQEEEIKDHHHHHQQVLVQQQEEKEKKEEDDDDGDDEGDEKPSEDLAMVFLEWLKSNKESISAEDLRSIKLKRSTIECAAKRLGGGKEGMKQLVKLILEWVQNHHLQKKRDQAKSSLFPSFNQENPNPSSISTSPSWVSSLSPYDSPLMYPPPPPPPPPPSMLSYMHGTTHDSSLFAPPPFNPHVNPYSSCSSTHDYNMFDSTTTSTPSPNWTSRTPTPPPPPPPPPHFSISSSQYMHQDPHLVPPPQPPTLQRSFSNYPCPQMFQGVGVGGEGSLMRLGSSATKEARKKRMARQRKLFSHHHRSNSSSSTHHQHQQTRLVVDNSCTTTTTTTTPPSLPLPLPLPNQAMNLQANNWVFWPSSPSPTSVAAPSLDPSPSMQNPQQNYHKQLALEKRHGCKPVEKNLKFLLQKVLKQSDVGNLGRIVLPKKEAETYLPELEARDGISIAMEDIGTSRIWNMRYRFWPNNKSRMYLLENTGEFVRSNGLQEGDFIVIYSDVKCGKYMIRGVKVRQPGSKCEVKKSTKAHRNLHHANSSVFNESSSSASFKQTVT